MLHKMGLGGQIVTPPQDLVLEVKNLKKHFPLQSSGLLRRTIGHIKAVDDVSFVVRRGETLGVIGESGCGKTTWAAAFPTSMSQPLAKS